MADRTHLETLLLDERARVLAFDPLGSSVVEMPKMLGDVRAEILVTGTPLELLTPAAQGLAVVAYEQARQNGHASATVHFIGDEQPFRADLFNLAEEAGCFLAVFVPASAETVRGDNVELPCRQSQMTMNVTGVIESVCNDFTRMFGWQSAEVVGLSSLDLLHPDDHEDGIIMWAALLEQPGTSTRIRQRFKHRNGTWIWCEFTDINQLDDAQPCVRAEIINISGEIKAQAALQRRETILDRLQQALPSGILHLDENGQAVLWNERWVELTGADGSTGLDGVLPIIDDGESVEVALSSARKDGVDVDLPIALSGRGSCRFGELHIRRLVEDDALFGLLVTLDDMTKLREQQHEFERLAHRDPLTGVFNLRGIGQVLDDLLTGSESDAAVLFLDMDGFKAINDAHGHRMGDEVLCATARTISELMRPGDSLGRLGGDEFLVVLQQPCGFETATSIAERIRDAVRISTRTLDGIDDVDVSIGIAMATPHDDADSLLRRADDAMYTEKRRRQQVA